MLRRILPHYAWFVLAAATASVFAGLGLGRFGYTMVLPDMRQALSLSYTQMGVLATGNFVGYLVFALLGGYLASRFGSRLIITLSLLFTGATMLLTGIAQGLPLALTGRTLTGMGSAGINVPAMGLVSSWFGRRRRGMASGLVVGGAGVGIVFTGWVVPRIIGQYPVSGWRFSWYLFGAISIVLGLLTWIVLRDRPEVLGLTPIGEETSSHTAKDATSRPPGASTEPTEEPSMLTMYRSPLLVHLGLVYAGFGFAYIIYATFFTAYLVEEQHLSAVYAGNLWSLVGILVLVCGFIWGGLSDVIGRRLGLALVYALMGIAILLMVIETMPIAYLLSAFLFGFTALSVPAIMAAACGDFVGPRLAPAAFGVVTVWFGVGQSIGPSVGGWLADQSGSFSTAFLLATAIALLGAGGALLLPREETAYRYSGVVPAERRVSGE